MRAFDVKNMTFDLSKIFLSVRKKGNALPNVSNISLLWCFVGATRDLEPRPFI